MTDGHAAGQFGQTLGEFFLIVIRSRGFHLLADLCDAVGDGFLVANAVYDGRVFFGDDHLVGRTQHVERSLIQADAAFFGDHRTAGQDGDVFEHLFTTVAETRSFHGGDLQRAAQFVDNQGCQRFAVDVFGDDHQRTSVLCGGFEHAHQLFHRRNLFVGNQDQRLFEHGFHFFGIGDEVRRDVSAVELHPFYYVYVRFGAFGFLYGDDAFLIHLAHRFGDQLADRVVVVGRNRGYLFDLANVAAHFLALLAQVFDDGSDRFVDTAFQIHRVRACGYVLHAYADNGLRQHGSRRGAVAGVVGRLRGHFLDHLGAHVGDRVFEFDLFGYGHAVLGRPAERRISYRLQRYVLSGPALPSQRLPARRRLP